VLPISEGTTETRANLKLARVITWQHGTRGTWRHHEWQQFTMTIKESSRVDLTLMHVFHTYASADTPWIAHALSCVSPMRYGRVSSNSVTVEASKFAGPHKIPYALVHNSNLLTRVKRSVLNWHRRGYHLGAPNFRSDHSSSFPSSILHFPLIAPPGLQLSKPLDHLAKQHRTSIDRKGHIMSGFQPLVFYR
jgi:hypothetical protein